MLVSLLALVVPAAAPTAPQFGPAENLTDAVERPRDLELVDLDGDGVLDLRLSSTFEGVAGARALHWLRGDGSGAFGDLREIARSPSPTDPTTLLQASASGDVDADGDVDVVACIPVLGPGVRIVLLANRGDGTFDPPLEISTLPGVAPSLLLLDWDADGDDDVFFGSDVFFPFASGSFALIESLGAGSFAAPVDVDATGAPATDLVAAGDIDGDGDVDLAVRRDVTTAAWYRNDGSVPFAGPFQLSATPLSAPRGAADFDGNGTEDILLATALRIEWSPNLGAGSFGPVQEIDSSPAGFFVPFASVQPIDVDRDGDVDVIGVRDGGDGVWFENLGGGTFSGRQVLPGVGSTAVCDLVQGDVDADGVPDLVTACGSARVEWIRNRSAGAGLLLDRAVEVMVRASSTSDLASGDLDGDGIVDVLGAVGPPEASRRVYASFGAPDGPEKIESLFPLTGVYEQIETGDLDADGDVDAAAFARPDGALVVLENPGDGALVVAEQLANTELFTFQVADVDGDGDDDIALADASAPGTIRWVEQTGAGLAPVAPLADLSVMGTTVRFVPSIRIADFDGDGTPDIVASVHEGPFQTQQGSIVFLRGQGNATFAPRMDLRTPATGELFRVEHADLDGDGRLDPIGIGEASAPALTWYRNLGGGAFAPEATIEPVGRVLTELVAFDADLDGDTDLFAGESLFGETEDLRQWENRGDGTFEPSVVAAVLPAGFRALEPGDFDGDGDVDIAAATVEGGGLVLLPSLAIRPIGEVECSSLPNSTGRAATTTATGSTEVAANRVRLSSTDLPRQSAGFYLASATPDSVPGAGGSQGVLCLGGSIGRYVGPGQVLNSGPAGAFSLEIDLTAVPQPTGFASVLPGETWRFQAWYRDAVGGVPVSNLTDGLAITFE